MSYCRRAVLRKIMKVAFIGHKRVPSNEGGIERVVERQATGLKSLGYEPVLYNRSGSISSLVAGRPKRIKSYKGMRIVTVPAPGGAFGVPLYSFLSTVHAAATGSDVLFFHASGPCNMIRLARLLGKPSVGMLHGLDSRRAKWGRFASWYLKKGEKAAATKADRCLVLSQSMKQMLEEEYGGRSGFGTKRIEVTSNQVDIPQRAGHDLIKDRWDLDPDGYIMTSARIVPEKEIHTLIKAFRECRTDKKLVIAGGASGRGEAYLAELKRLAGDDERILFAGHVDTEAITELYFNAYVFVLASSLEGMSVALLEAMAAGCCCLTSDISENTDVTGDAGISFRTGDVEDLKEKLEMLLADDDTVKELGRRARMRAEKASGDPCIELLDEILREVAGGEDVQGC